MTEMDRVVRFNSGVPPYWIRAWLAEDDNGREGYCIDIIIELPDMFLPVYQQDVKKYPLFTTPEEALGFGEDYLYYNLSDWFGSHTWHRPRIIEMTKECATALAEREKLEKEERLIYHDR